MSTVAKKVIMGSGAVAEPLEIEQSLIFDETRGSFLGRASSAISAGNQRTFTFSTWVKLCSKPAQANNTHFMMARPTAGGGPLFSIMVLGTEKQLYIFEKNNSSVTRWALQCSAVLRDHAAWYHIVVAIDTTQAANANKVKPYINGVLQTSFVTAGYPDQNDQMPWNGGAVPQYLGWNVGSSGDFYMAETHSIDGAAKAASDFGETNEDTGQWIPKKYSGSYGTNGFYLKFVSGAIGTDSSGESNNYTATNLANADVVTDTPTNNFATLLPFAGFGTYASNTPTTTAITTSEGNLVGTGASGINGSGSMAVSSGKWYWEVMVIGSSGYGHAGIYGYGSGRISDSSRVDNGNKYRFMLNADDGEWQYATNGGSFSSAAAITGDGGNAVNGPWAASLTCFGTGSKLHFNFGQNGTFNGAATAGGNADSGGVGDFFYAPPSGYLALCTANLPDPAIPLPSAHFNTVLYTGTGATPQTVTGVGFQPDFVWIKNRPTGATNHVMYDAVRGTNKTVASSTTNAESSDDTAGFSAFTSDGFTLRSLTTAQGTQNALNQAHVSWNWKANGSGSTNNDGATATVSANQAAGFSIVSYANPSGSDVAIGHGLGVKPELWIVKNRDSVGDNFVYTTAIDGGGDYLKLNATDAANAWGGTVPTTSLWYETFTGGTGEAFICYLFASKPGFSKIGVYTGNGNADGPFVNLGFKPAWLMIKNTTNAQDWMIWDIKRNPFNEVTQFLYPNLYAAEAAGSGVLDLVSNGFKLRNAGTRNRNYNGDVYLYQAFADSPFKTATAR